MIKIMTDASYQFLVDKLKEELREEEENWHEQKILEMRIKITNLKFEKEVIKTQLQNEKEISDLILKEKLQAKETEIKNLKKTLQKTIKANKHFQKIVKEIFSIIEKSNTSKVSKEIKRKMETNLF